MDAADPGLRSPQRPAVLNRWKPCSVGSARPVAARAGLLQQIALPTEAHRKTASGSLRPDWESRHWPDPRAPLASRLGSQQLFQNGPTALSRPQGAAAGPHAPPTLEEGVDTDAITSARKPGRGRNRPWPMKQQPLPPADGWSALGPLAFFLSGAPAAGGLPAPHSRGGWINQAPAAIQGNNAAGGAFELQRAGTIGLSTTKLF